MLYKSRNNVIKLCDDYTSVVSEVKHATIKGTWMKILTPEQRLPIPLTQVKAGFTLKIY